MHADLSSPGVIATPGLAGPWAWAAAARSRTPWLWWSGWAVLAMTLPLLLLMAMDGRSFNGVSVWLKPWKFHLSVGVHLLTLALVAAALSETPGRRRALGRLSAVAVVTGVFELAYITWRASRGEASHFNVADPMAGLLYGLMGVGAVLLTGCAGVLAWWVARDRGFASGPVLQRGLALGLLAGWLLGTLTGAVVSAQSGHWVGGTPSDAGGLPLLGWSRDGGDLRVAHFFGLHAMHVLPLVAWALARWLSPRRALAAVSLFTVIYTGWTLFTLLTAWRGQPLV
ncbi:hypothetical protein [Rubrivivax albus]|uniref:Uncharacterized protein n=1 Tax=Rubrivivax albus TaxID=2499835 RepID=A0A437JS29_9BURK|nr:hypothetical protein [Rubrivivax albus]RVT49706.1 hypothetical protein ENE75_18865 [Rubrivivax albus]